MTRTDPDLLNHLREDARGLLAEVADVFAELKRADVADAVHADAEALDDLELVIPIVAPTNAGKSTILNVIAGADLLPTRAGAMTTLPTRIVLDPEVGDPVLRFADADVAELDLITREIAAAGPESLEPHPLTPPGRTLAGLLDFTPRRYEALRTRGYQDAAMTLRRWLRPQRAMTRLYLTVTRAIQSVANLDRPSPP